MVGQNLNTAAQPTVVTRPSHPVAQYPVNKSDSNPSSRKFSIMSLLSQKADVGTDATNLAKNKMVEYNRNKHSQGKDTWSVGSNSPAQSGKKKADWRLPRHDVGVAEEKNRGDARKGQFAAIKESGANNPLTKAKLHGDGVQPSRSRELSGGNSLTRGKVNNEPNRTRDFGDLDSLLSDIGNFSTKKENR